MLPPEVYDAIETGNYQQEDQMNVSDEEEDPSEREPAFEDWEDKEVILEEPEMVNNMEVGQNFGGWMESYD